MNSREIETQIAALQAQLYAQRIQEENNARQTCVDVEKLPAQKAPSTRYRVKPSDIYFFVKNPENRPFLEEWAAKEAAKIEIKRAVTFAKMHGDKRDFSKPENVLHLMSENALEKHARLTAKMLDFTAINSAFVAYIRKYGHLHQPNLPMFNFGIERIHRHNRIFLHCGCAFAHLFDGTCIYSLWDLCRIHRADTVERHTRERHNVVTRNPNFFCADNFGADHAINLAWAQK